MLPSLVRPRPSNTAPLRRGSFLADAADWSAPDNAEGTVSRPAQCVARRLSWSSLRGGWRSSGKAPPEPDRRDEAQWGAPRGSGETEARGPTGGERAMSKITVSIEAEGQDSFTFEWEGDPEDLQDNIDVMEILARRNGLDPEQFVKSALMQFPSTGLIPGPGGETQRMMILCAILSFVDECADELPPRCSTAWPSRTSSQQ
jgi:hypothetical protein